MSLSRRDFLKSGCLSLAALAFRQLEAGFMPWPPQDGSYASMLGRVTRRNTPVYTGPDLSSPRLYKLERDALVHLLEAVESPGGPAYNPRWYRLERGYVHSASIQRVEAAQLSQPVRAVPESGLLGQVSVPYTQVMYQNRQKQWQPLYRLYYGSVHWITGIESSPEGELLYRLTDEWLRVDYLAPAAHLRALSPQEYAPFTDGVPAEEKRLEVSIARQTLTAYQGREVLREMKVSTGERYTPTPLGEFRVDRKHPSKHMGDGGLTSDLRAYELVGVPWVSFFQTAGIAFHGTFWHDNFGYPMSNGCVNLPTADALWLFRWTAPDYNSQRDDRPTWKITGKGGTAVYVA